MNNYIGIDLGTSSVKMLLVSKNGEILKSVTKEYPICYPKSGWSEQNPYDWYDATMVGLKELIADIPLLQTLVSRRFLTQEAS